MFLQHFLITEVNEANVYLVACGETRQAALIDAAAYDLAVIDSVRKNQLNVQYILITHDHYDHTGGLAEYAAAFPDCEIAAGGDIPGIDKGHILRDDESFQIGKLVCRAILLPGHTKEGVAYHVAKMDAVGKPIEPSVVFSGDALFAGSVGGTSSTASHEQEISGIRSKLFPLPGPTLIYPGHGPGTTVAIEKQFNPFFTNPDWED